MPILSGRTLGEFIVREKIGQGGFGEVYRAEQPALAREAVIKVLHGRYRGVDAATQRFLREALLASRLDHPYAAHIYAFGAEPDGVLWIAMELVRGTPLSRLIQTQGPVPLERFVPLLEKLCEVVHTAHEQRIVHRDIKPANVMVISRAGRFLPKLLDFGIGKSADDGPEPTPPVFQGAPPLVGGIPTSLPASSPRIPPAPTMGATLGSMDETPIERVVATPRPPPTPDLDDTVAAVAATPASPRDYVTIPGAMIGSPPYMSPEQWQGAPADLRSDLYALGVLAYETLAGKLPFTAKSVAEWSEAHQLKSVPPLGPAFPAALGPVLARAMAKRPADRFASALELAAALREASGITLDEPAPVLDPGVREPTLLTAPPPIAEAVAALDAARDPHQILAAIAEVVSAVVRTLTIWALAARTRISPPDADHTQVAALLQAMRERVLDDEEWLALARAASQPFAGLRDAHPLPELVAFFDQGAPPLVAGTPTSLPGAGAEIAARLLAARWPAEARARRPRGEAREAVARALPELARLLEATRFLSAYPIVAVREGGLGETWMGLSRAQRALIPLRGDPQPEGCVLLADQEGRPVLVLSPLVQVGAPSPGSPPELFALAGGGRTGARLCSPAGFERHDPELWGWLGARLLPGHTDPRGSPAEIAPFRGLATFSPDDADVFVGREREIDQVLNRIRAQPLTVIVGPSGAGKSSFVQAGIIPALPAGWTATTLRPGASPLTALAAKVARGMSSTGAGEATAAEVAATRALLAADPELFGKRVAQVAERETLVLVVDQLEELVTQCVDPVERAQFAEAIVRAPRAAGGRLRLVCTVRDDFLVKLDEIAALHDRLAAGFVLLGTPAPPDLVRILVEPARRAGYEFDDRDLPARMVAEVAGRPGALALLSFTAVRLWELRDRHFQKLTRTAYEAMGGVGGALAQHAEATLHALPEGEQRLVREAFRHLVTADGTRATLTRGELDPLLGGGRAQAVIDRLVDARLLVTRDVDDDGAGVEIIHETLLTAWPRLVGWQKEDAEGARLRDQLRAAARQWDERKRPGGLLWRGDALDELRLWRKRHTGPLTPAEEAFAGGSFADDRKHRRARTIAIVAAFLALVAGLFGLWRLNKQTDVARAGAHQRVVDLYHEQGREALLAGDAGAAFVYLLEAYREGDHSTAVKIMLHRATAIVSAQERSFEHGAAVWNAVFSADGTQILTTSADGTAARWSVSSGARLATYAGAQGTVWGAALARNQVITVAQDGNLRVYDVDGALQATHAAGEPIRVLAISPDGTRLAIGGWSGTVVVWDAHSGAELLRTKAHDMVMAMAYSPDGKLLVTAGRADLRVWSADGTPLTALAEGNAAEAHGFAFSADGAHLASACAVSDACVWHLPDGALEHRLVGHSARVLAAGFGAGDRLIVTSSDDRSAKLWNAQDGRFLRSLDGHRSEVWWSELSPDGHRVVTASADGDARLWDVDTGRMLLPLVGHRKGVRWAHFAPDGAHVVTAGLDGAAKLWSTQDREVLRVINAHKGGVDYVAYEDPKTIVSAGQDGSLRRWSAATGEPLSATAIDGNVVATSASGDALILRNDAGLTVRDARDAKPLFATAMAKDDEGNASVSDDHAWFAALDSTRGEVELWRVATHEKIQTIAHEGLALAFAPSNQLLAIGQPQGTIELWSLTTPHVVAELEGHEQKVTNIVFDRAHGRIASTSLDQTSRIWSMSGDLLRTVKDISPTYRAQFSLDGDFLITTNLTEGRLWDVGSGRLIRIFARNPALKEAVAAGPLDDQIALGDDDGFITIWDTSTDLPALESLAEMPACRLSRGLDATGNLVEVLPSKTCGW